MATAATASTPSATTSAPKPSRWSIRTATFWLTMLSSASRIRGAAGSAVSAAGRGAAGCGAASGGAAATAGVGAASSSGASIVKLKTEPWPDRLSTIISPPIISTRRRLMIRPRPIPP